MLGIAGVLSLVLGMALPAAGALEAAMRAAVFAGGGTAYALLALAAAWALDDRHRRMFLSEALRAFARYLRARAALYGAPHVPGALASVIEAHGAFMERLQPARDSIFTGRATARRRRWVGGIVALLDAYEAVLSTDADLEMLPSDADGAVREGIARLTRLLAADVETMALALVVPATRHPTCDHSAEIASLDAALAATGERAAVFAPTRDKLAETARRIERLTDALGRGDVDTALPPGVELGAFVQVTDTRRATLGAHMTLTSPVMRYAIRLTLAMLAGYVVTVALPGYVHGGWVLLTVALIMRASYALTRQRRNDRILGTLAGCVVAAGLIPVLSTPALLALVVVGVGVAHAFAATNYRVTSFAASLMALLLVHILEPHEALVLDRIVDTLIGAALSIVFARLLPSWEWRDVPRLVSRLIAADRSFAVEALQSAPAEQAYRLTRKRLLDAFTALATATRRLAGEPRTGPHRLADVNALIGANYLFVSDVTSVRSLMRMRGGEIEPATAQTMLDGARARVGEVLACPPADAPPADVVRRSSWAELLSADARTFLARRLAHIETAAARLSALAARAAAGPAT